MITQWCENVLFFVSVLDNVNVRTVFADIRLPISPRRKHERFAFIQEVFQRGRTTQEWTSRNCRHWRRVHYSMLPSWDRFSVRIHQTITTEQSVGQLSVASAKQRVCSRSIQQAQRWASATRTDENDIHHQTPLGTTQEMEKTICSSKNSRPRIFVNQNYVYSKCIKAYIL